MLLQIKAIDDLFLAMIGEGKKIKNLKTNLFFCLIIFKLVLDFGYWNITSLDSQIYKAETKVMGTLSVEDKYINRVREGFSAVVQNGLGYGYMGYYTNSAGKTGTSQSFIDTDGDNKVDTETITTSFVGYSPSDSPKMSIVVVSPDAGIPDVTQSGVTKRISSQIVNKFFELNQ